MFEAGFELDLAGWTSLEEFARAVAVLPVNSVFSGWLADFRRVGEVAGEFACQIFSDSMTRNPRPDIQRATAVGLLYYAMDDHGLTYDDLSQYVGRQLATDVATVSADRRMPWLQRSLLVASQLGQADKPIQLAAMAEMVARCDRLHEQALVDPNDQDLLHWGTTWVQTRQTVLLSLSAWKKSEPFKQAEMRLMQLRYELTGETPKASSNKKTGR